MGSRAKPPAGGNKKQAVSLARRMAGKKGAVVQLQAEINSEEDWDKLLLREGLVVVDVYSDWCGPCVGMVGNLKKCKLEMGGDMLHMLLAEFVENQAVSLARRMAGKKGAVVQLQAEINSEEDWDKLLLREGLVVVDVYSDWCGPCVGMVGNLKKCKLEMGGDMLHLAIAKADEIEVLKRFRNKSEPTWMFIAGGQLLNVMFGANAPRLMQLIETELKNEQKVLKGELQRKTYRFDELTPEEELRAAALAKRQAEEAREAAARELAARNEERDRRYAQMLEALISETIALCLPHTVGPEGCDMAPDLEATWARLGLSVTETAKVDVTPEMWEEITYREGSEMTEDIGACLGLGPCLALLLRSSQFPPIGVPLPEAPGDIERTVWEALNMSTMQPGIVPTPHPDSIPAKFNWKPEVHEEELTSEEGKAGEPSEVEEGKEEVTSDNKGAESSAEGTGSVAAASVITRTTNVPGLFTPVSALSKCAAVVHLFPARAQKIAVADSKPLPPRMALVFEPDKADECFALAEEMPEEVLGIGFFDKADPEEATLLARTPKQYSKIPANLDNKLVVVVAKRQSEPVLSFAALGPLYVSPDEAIGALEADKFFPPGIQLDPVVEDSEEDSFEDFELEDEEEDETEKQRLSKSQKLSHLSAGEQSGQRPNLVNETLSAEQSSNGKDRKQSRTRSKDQKGSQQRLSGTGRASQSVSRSSGKSNKLLDQERKSSTSRDRPRRSSGNSSEQNKTVPEKLALPPFPPQGDDEEEDEDLGKSLEGGMTPTTAVTAK